MFTVFSIVWFTSGQEFIGITEGTIASVWEEIRILASTGKQPKTGGINWIANAVRVHHEREFFTTIKLQTDDIDIANKKVEELNSTIEFKF